MKFQELFSMKNKKRKVLKVSSAAVVLDILILCMLGNFACFFVVCGFFLKLTFSKKSFRNTIRVSNSLDPDQAQ